MSRDASSQVKSLFTVVGTPGVLGLSSVAAYFIWSADTALWLAWASLVLTPAIIWRFLRHELVQTVTSVLEKTAAMNDQADLARKVVFLQDALKERDRWRDLYMADQAGHNAAQALMLRQIVTLHQALQKVTGKIVPLDPVMLRVCEELGLEVPGATPRTEAATEPEKRA